MDERSLGPRPIETLYKGYRFRSRLGARWAVFLDAIGVEWEYEKQGYDLNGRWYLPDFWVPYPPMKDDGWGYWIEIKPTNLTEEQTGILAELARVAGHRTFAICGQPWPDEHRISIFLHHHHGVPERIPLLSEGRLVEEDHPFLSNSESHAIWRERGYSRPPRFPKIHDLHLMARKPGSSNLTSSGANRPLVFRRRLRPQGRPDLNMVRLLGFLDNRFHNEHRTRPPCRHSQPDMEFRGHHT